MYSRLKENQALLEYLKAYIDVHPNQRFSQILNNYGFVRNTEDSAVGTAYNMNWKDEFYLESDKLLERVEKIYEENINK